jgi:hypothetical protein
MKVFSFHLDRHSSGCLRIVQLIALPIVLAVILTLRPAFAQSSNLSSGDSALSSGDSALGSSANTDMTDASDAPGDNLDQPPPAEPPIAPAPAYSSDPAAVTPADASGGATDSAASSSADSSSSDSSDSSAATSPATSSDGRSPADPAWTRADDRTVSGDDDSSNATLELPQVVDNNAAAAGAQGTADATTGDASDATQTANADRADTDTLGGIDDYQDQPETSVAGIYAVPVPVLVQPMVRAPSPYRPVPLAGNPALIGGTQFPPGFIIRQRVNSMNSAFAPTSPMLMPSRGVAAMPGGWWTRAR